MIEFKNTEVTYPGGLKALKGVTLDIPTGQFVVIVGLSGAGKSTLIRTINNLVVPSGGEVLVGGKSISKASGAELRQMRADIGMIFQTFNLVKRSTVIRNVLSGRLGSANPLLSLFGIFSKEDTALAHDCLRRVGIGEKAFVRADALSGGQQQRVGIARALAQDPSVMLADEPVASLDPPTSTPSRATCRADPPRRWTAPSHRWPQPSTLSTWPESTPTASSGCVTARSSTTAARTKRPTRCSKRSTVVRSTGKATCAVLPNVERQTADVPKRALLPRAR
ncbi:MAG: phosphonate ABC transporter ATP-binding protein [Trueperaceae bacterium]|nr:phosphonate ABC transporter ATP-binding protein [Trueperaceae bacterium]